jgi:ubiquinone/menaquinone biosynthesis C-methylase UbiE
MTSTGGPPAADCCGGNGRALNVDAAVRERYSAAARATQGALCCPVDYDTQYLEVIPQEVLDRDYGCGDPSRHVASGDVVLDLGSGGGKICFIAAQIVGPTGRVIGVDCNDDMLALARRHQPTVAQRLGFDNIEFRKGKIQDLQLNLELLDEYLRTHPVQGSTDWLHAAEHADHVRANAPLVADDSVDVVVSNCVLNLVRDADRRQLFAELHRVLRRGGRAVISDIVSDEDVPESLRRDATLWSGCISGAFREDQFLEAFEEAGFYGIELVARQEQPWAMVEGIEFRSVTVRAWKGKEGPCLDARQAVIYNGPWKAVMDDDGHELIRGKRMAVCDKTFRIYTRPPYAHQITAVPPAEPVSLEEAAEFDSHAGTLRSPRETKVGHKVETLLPIAGCCGPEECC